uniref:Uncharacterized protein n=1 Tax=Arundo donax TaxID=35708 RepID=A0A0A9BKH0_ARUDO
MSIEHLQFASSDMFLFLYSRFLCKYDAFCSGVNFEYQFELWRHLHCSVFASSSFAP